MAAPSGRDNEEERRNDGEEGTVVVPKKSTRANVKAREPLQPATDPATDAGTDPGTTKVNKQKRNDRTNPPDDSTPTTENDDETQREDIKLQGLSKVFSYAGVLIALVIAVIAISVVSSYSGDESESQNPGSDSNFDYSKIYGNGLLKLQEDFKNQTDRFWKILKARGLAHLRKASPPQPLVLLIVAPPSAHSAVNCFTKKLAAKLDPEHAKQLKIIDGKDYISSPGHVTKEELDKNLKETLQSGRRVAVISNLQLLPPPSPLLFYSYCDNDNAPYKHVAILFTVQLPREPNPSLSPVETEGLVEKFLSREVWADGSEYDLDAVAALLSRIADTVVVLSGEDKQNLEAVCDSS